MPVFTGALFGVILLTAPISPASAQDLRIGCSLVRQYDSSDVRLVIEQVRTSVSESEANTLHAKYVGLKNDCSSNQNAFRMVHVSPAMNRLLNEYGVDVRRFTF
jgi:hypothetical protein